MRTFRETAGNRSAGGRARYLSVQRLHEFDLSRDGVHGEHFRSEEAVLDSRALWVLPAEGVHDRADWSVFLENVVVHVIREGRRLIPGSSCNDRKRKTINAKAKKKTTSSAYAF